MTNIVEFPYDKIKNPLENTVDEDLSDIAGDMVEAALEVAISYGYSPTMYEGGIPDYGVVLNVFYATLARANGREHFMHPILEEVAGLLEEIKAKIKEQNDSN